MVGILTAEVLTLLGIIVVALAVYRFIWLRRRPGHLVHPGNLQQALYHDLKKIVDTAWVGVGTLAVLAFMWAVVGVVTQDPIMGGTSGALLLVIGIYLLASIFFVPDDYWWVVMVLGRRWGYWGPGRHFRLLGLMTTPSDMYVTQKELTVPLFPEGLPVEINRTRVVIKATAIVRVRDPLKILFSVDGQDNKRGHEIILQQLVPQTLQNAIQVHIRNMTLDEVRNLRGQSNTADPGVLVPVIKPAVQIEFQRLGVELVTCIVADADAPADIKKARDTKVAFEELQALAQNQAKVLAGIDPAKPDNELTQEERAAIATHLPEAMEAVTQQQLIASGNFLPPTLTDIFARQQGSQGGGRRRGR